MAWQDDVQATLNDLCALRAAFIAEQLAGKLKPSYNVQGHSFNWVEYGKYLSEQIDACLKQLVQGEPFEIISRGL